MAYHLKIKTRAKLIIEAVTYLRGWRGYYSVQPPSHKPNLSLCKL